MKRETVILAVVIAFLVGFISGATVAILKGRRGAEVEVAQKPPGPSEMAPAPESHGPTLAEVEAKIQALKDILQRDSKNLSALLELGNLYFDTDRPQEAIDAYSNYLAIHPGNADVRTDMGIMYRRVGNFDRALQEFQAAAKSDPAHVNSRFNIGIVLLHDKQDLRGAIRAWEEYLKVDPNSDRANRVKAQMARLRELAK